MARGWGGRNKPGCCGFVVIAGLMLLIVGQVKHSPCKFHSIVQGALVVVGLLIRSLIEESLVEELEDRLKVEFNMAGGEAFSRAVDLAQVTWSCCGIVGPEDYNSSLWRQDQKEDGAGLVVPLSCCILNHPKSYLSPVPKDLGMCQNVSSPALAPTRHLEVKCVLCRMRYHLILPSLSEIL